MDWQALVLTSTNAILAVAGIVSAVAAWRAVAQQRDMMRRPEPAIESRRPHPWKEDPSWQAWDLVLRNLHTVSARLVSAEVKPRDAFVLDERSAYSEVQYGERNLLSVIPEARKIELGYLVGPAGTQRSASGYDPGGTVYVTLLTKGITSMDQIAFTWEWMDGKRF